MRLIFCLLVSLLMLTASSVSQAQDLVSKIRASGSLVVGVKVDYPPWGMMNEDGEHSGFEPDLAKLIAQEIGSDKKKVNVVFKTVSSANRFSKLNEGEVDLLIATVGDTTQRRQHVNMTLPHYYKSGVKVLIKKSSKFNRWSDLIGEPVCLTAGAYFNKSLIQSYRINPVILMSNRDAELALLKNKCVAWAYDSGVLHHLSQQDELKDYHLNFQSILPIYWSVVTRNDAGSVSLFNWLSDFLEKNIRSGTLLSLAEKWSLPEKNYLKEQYETWLKREDNGKFLCQTSLSEKINRECFDESLDFSTTSFINYWPFDRFDTKRIIESIIYTVFFTLFTILMAVMFSVLFNFITLKTPWNLGRLMSLITNLQSFVPPILMLYLIYFGFIPYYFYWADNFFLNSFFVSMIILSLYTSSGINNLIVSHFSYDMSLMDNYIKNKISVRANLVNLVKASGMASVLASPNAVLVMSSLSSESGQSLLLMSMLAIFYYFEVLFFSFLISKFFSFIESKRQSISVV